MRSQYRYDEIEEVNINQTEVFIMGLGEDERSLSTFNQLKENNVNLHSIIVLQYDEITMDMLVKAFPGSHIEILRIGKSQKDLLQYRKKLIDLLHDRNILVDITEIRVPELFVLLRLIKLCISRCTIRISYSTPMDYYFEDEPFLSYHSFHGDLKTEEILGYGGSAEDASHTQMIIFLGFEGVLSQKVNEDIQYQKLVLVNNLPSVFAKYKDISIICNYELLKLEENDINYVPANNPFETYNFLERTIRKGDSVCIAPLSTKVVALGVCLYALEHENARIIYPTGEEYTKRHAVDIHKTYVYDVDIIAINEEQ